MTITVSISEKGQNKPKPSKEARDAAASMESGRKAIEEPIEQLLAKNCAKEANKTANAEPIGLEMETKGDCDVPA